MADATRSDPTNGRPLIEHLRGEVEFWVQRSDGWERYAKELEQQLEAAGCTCGVSEPDEFGNRDLLERADCPLHGEA